MDEYRSIKLELEPVFLKAGLAISHQQNEADASGSKYSEYQGRGLTYKIVWNQLNQQGHIQFLSKSGWSNLNQSIPPSTHNAFSAALLRAKIELVEHIGMEKLNA